MSTPADWHALLDLADRLEPKARALFLEAVIRLRDQIDVDAIAHAIATGQTLSGVLLITQREIVQALQPLLDVTQDAFLAGGRLTAQQLADRLQSPVRFDITNPHAVEFAQREAARLVTQITGETELAIRNTIARAFTDGLTRRDVSALVRPLVGLTDRQAAAVARYRANLVDSGLARDRVGTLIDRYAARQLQQRAENIARTEIMTASNGGQHTLWQQAIDAKLLDPEVERRWTITPDDRLCPYCRSMAGQLRKMYQDFFCPRNGRVVRVPPLHPRCRCVVVLVIKSRRAA